MTSFLNHLTGATTEIENLTNTIKNLEKGNNYLTQEIRNLKSKNQELTENNKSISKEVEKNKLETTKLMKSNEELKNKIKQLEEEIKNKNQNELNLNKNIKELENKNENLMKAFEEYKNKEKKMAKLEEIIKNNKSKEIDLENKFKSIEVEKAKLTSKLSQLENNEEKEKLEKDPLEFYDIIVNINSMQNIKREGWEIRMNESGKKITEDKNEKKRLVIGVIGNRNKGKSFMLQALSGEKMQTGTTINTIGLSIKYSEDKFVLLDCAGSESPILGENTNLQNVSRDKLFTEAFLQSYIIKNSNAILLVVGNLTFSEQKLINKISENLKSLNLRGKTKNLIIIHNLQTYETIAQVENYIDTILKQSASFNIVKEESNFYNSNEFFFDGNNNSIKHFIYAKENSEAGNYYNRSTINNIKNLYNIETNKYRFDFKQTIIEHFKEMGEQMYDFKEKINLDLEEVKQENKENKSQEVTKENNEMNDENKEAIEKKETENPIVEKNTEYLNEYKSYLIFKGDEKLVLKKMVIDELGVASFIKNGFNPDYECYYNKKELVLKIECPEGVELTAKRKRNKSKNISSYLFAIEVTGKKNEDKPLEETTYIKKKQFGNYYLLIPFEDDNYTLGEKTEEEPKNGWKTFKFALSRIEDD